MVMPTAGAQLGPRQLLAGVGRKQLAAGRARSGEASAKFRCKARGSGAARRGAGGKEQVGLSFRLVRLMGHNGARPALAAVSEMP